MAIDCSTIFSWSVLKPESERRLEDVGNELESADGSLDSNLPHLTLLATGGLINNHNFFLWCITHCLT